MTDITRVVKEQPQFEALINGLIEKEFGCADDFFPPDTLTDLRNSLLEHHGAGGMYPAGVGKNFDYVKNAAIRGDLIRWIDPGTEVPCERVFLSRVAQFTDYLNASCYTGITDVEFHYAYYEAGSFYKRHLDRFRHDKGRQFSFVLYLNDDWKEEHGGRLSIYLGSEEFSVYPLQGRVVFFRSDKTEHEVHPSHERPRLSIAGWLKRGV